MVDVNWRKGTLTFSFVGFCHKSHWWFVCKRKMFVTTFLQVLDKNNRLLICDSWWFECHFSKYRNVCSQVINDSPIEWLFKLLLKDLGPS